MHACARACVCVLQEGEELLKLLCVQAPTTSDRGKVKPSHSHPGATERTTWRGLSEWTSRITAQQYQLFGLSTGEVVFALFDGAFVWRDTHPPPRPTIGHTPPGSLTEHSALPSGSRLTTDRLHLHNSGAGWTSHLKHVNNSADSLVVT